jgi:hypothetical protein
VVVEELGNMAEKGERDGAVSEVSAARAEHLESGVIVCEGEQL